MSWSGRVTENRAVYNSDISTVSDIVYIKYHLLARLTAYTVTNPRLLTEQLVRKLTKCHLRTFTEMLV